MGAPPEKQHGSGEVARSRTLARRGARLAAVQSLYQMDIAGTGIDAVIGERLSYAFEIDRDNGAPLPVLARDGGDLPDPDSTFMSEILRGVVRRQRDIDTAIDQQLAAGWRLTRIELDRSRNSASRCFRVGRAAGCPGACGHQRVRADCRRIFFRR